MNKITRWISLFWLVSLIWYIALVSNVQGAEYRILKNKAIGGIVGFCCYDEDKNSILLVNKYCTCYELNGKDGVLYYKIIECPERWKEACDE